ncbi:sodium channel protein Nach-like [Adelges cooleyi]|uniref:sodium channel protein Nach-like n=1 Tax=Adelges cooleyi TaxID=133065 RepID=UPI0021807476|nr:sodium channel protein Nach-like [Adelges cooleyi]
MAMKDIWCEYCEYSSIHGLRHVVQKDAKPWERVTWALLLVAASLAILVLLNVSWKKYVHSPMQIVVDDPRYPLSKIDFPAITICSINKIMYSKVNALISTFTNDTELGKKYMNSFRAMSILRFPFYNEAVYFIRKYPTVNLPLDQITTMMLQLKPSINEMFKKCYWRGTNYNCTDLLRLQRTEEGYCYSFNSKTAERSINDSDITPPESKPDGSLVPLRNNAGGKVTGFEVVMNDMDKEYIPDDLRPRGYNVIVHTPDDFPDVSDSYKLYQGINKVSQLSVSVSKVSADKSLYRLSEDRRNCVMHKDHLADQGIISQHGSSDSENNCKSRCRLKTIFQICNCTPYFYNTNKKNVTQCGIQHMACLRKINVLQRNTQPLKDQPGFPKWSIPVYMNCSCPQPCSFLTYTTEIRNKIREYVDTSRLSEFIGPIYLDFHFKEHFAISYIRSMKYNTQDLLVSFGGVASLFLGCSLVSLIEIMYFIYKSILVLRQKPMDPKKDNDPLQQVLFYRRYHHSCHLRKPLYRIPQPVNIKSSDNQFYY